MGQQTSDVTRASDFDPVQARLTGADGGTPIETEIIYGQDGHGTDFKVFGATSGTYMKWDEDLNSLLLIGTAAKFRLGTFNGATQGYGSALSASNTAAFRVYADDGGAAIGSGTLARAGVFRNLLTYTGGNREQEAAGVVGQVVSVAGTNRHNMCGVMGSYEARTSLTVDGQAWATDPWAQAAVIGRVGVGDGITTINDNAILAGFAAMSLTTSFLANNGYYTGLFVGKWNGMVDWGYGIVIDSAAVSTAGFYMPGGTAVKGIKLGTLSSDTPGSGLTLDATITRIVEVHADDDDTARAIGTQGRAIFGRTMIYKDNACEDWGVDGLSKISEVAKTGNVSAGVVGRFESTGTCSTATGSGNTFVAGVMGRLGLGSGFTIGAGTFACGVLSFYNTLAANDPSGEYTVAFMATASDIAGMGDWDYGLYIEDTATGIYLSSCTTGISIASATGYAIDIQTTGQFRMGQQDTGIPTATDTPYAVEIHAETNADAVIESPYPGTGLSCGIRCRYEISKAQTAMVSFTAIEGRLRPKAGLADGVHSAVSGTIEGDASIAYTGTSTTQRSAGNFCVELGASSTLSAGWLTGVTIDSSTNGNVDMVNVQYCGLRIKTSTDKEVWEHGIYIDASACTTGITIGTATTGMSIGAGCTSALQIGAAATAAGSGVTVNAAAPVGFYFDDGGAALTAWSESFTVGLVLPTASAGAAQTGFPSATHIYIDQRANYTGPAAGYSMTALWAGYLVRNGATLDGFDTQCVSAIQASIDIDTNCTLAAGTTMGGIQFGGNWSLGTVSGMIFPLVIVPTNADWTGFLCLNSSQDEGIVQDAAATGGSEKYLRVYIEDKLYTIEMTTTS